MKQVFSKVVETMRADYAGSTDKRGWDDPERYRKELNNQPLSREQFTNVVKDYLLDFEDPHLFFVDRKQKAVGQKDRGFQLRRFKDELYVTHVGREQRVVKGDRFIRLDDTPVHIVKQTYSRLLRNEKAEREDWSKVLPYVQSGTFIDQQGAERTIELTNYPSEPPVAVHTVQSLDQDIALITLTDFANPNDVHDLLKRERESLSKKKWIFDVRVNHGGSDASFHPLLDYVMPIEGVELYDESEMSEYFCTENNTDRMVHFLHEQLESVEDPGTIDVLTFVIREWERHRGAGFVDFDHQQVIPNTFIRGRSDGPEHIVLLTDVMCGSSGDSFVEVCKKSSKVTVMGRATLGLNDYANIVTEDVGDGFALMYATSRLKRIDEGKGMTGVGIVPDIHIPWTPDHIHTDVDLHRAIQFLNKSFS
ncbi:TSPc, tail specific protease [Geomicrobium sp. JCM 19037]|uniref:S41 family peptidase n=1 Tax=Geomicrobium sp. JCM 19037 TaxID=1460634 RepID=UPI00045F10C2|nr:S41 family peptidase [Geomicrobium sp. JCM 19037]GAK04030.1 TSPc, tail specific protease [Geomicrobium sp. JCM 19037]